MRRAFVFKDDRKFAHTGNFGAFLEENRIMEEDLLGKKINYQRFEYFEPKPEKAKIKVLGQSLDIQHLVDK